MLFPTSGQRKFLPFAAGLLFLGLTFLNYSRIDSTSLSVSDTMVSFIPQTMISAILFLSILYFVRRVSGRKSNPARS